ncbi:hypothetical protein RHEC894_PC00341 (plasmid) [Rhizobium sp. CIAT894]|nr:hypothetical protein RHEC894_PC00341 [Rhizobium sp. CIAT894]
MQTDVSGATNRAFRARKLLVPEPPACSSGAAGQVGGVAIGAGRPARRQRAER